MQFIPHNCMFYSVTLLHSKQPKLYGVLAILSAIQLKYLTSSGYLQYLPLFSYLWEGCKVNYVILKIVICLYYTMSVALTCIPPFNTIFVFSVYFCVELLLNKNILLM